MYDSLSKDGFLRTGILGTGLVSRMVVGAAALYLTHAVATGAETADGRFAQEAELSGIVLGMEKNATSSQLPHVSGSLAGAVSLVKTSLEDQKKQSIRTESENGSFPSRPSNYKTSYYSPDIILSGDNTGWTWRLDFVANEDISLVQTQVAFFSCDKTFLPKSCKTTIFTILYTLKIDDGGTPLASIQGMSTLSAAAESSGAGYDFATAKITSGSGAVATATWSETVLLKQGRTYTYSMTVSPTGEAVADNTGVGFGGIRFIAQSLPEPSSAALLLIGIVFFVSRRRRDSCV